jgi:LmbE family N-acetylglucosaminyl deacetylase
MLHDKPDGGSSAEGPPLLRLLIILAHPDDESFAVGATAARYASEGHMVALATLTPGGAGVWCGKDVNEARLLTEVRRREMACAAHALGIAPLFVLDYPDGALAQIAPPLRATCFPPRRADAPPAPGERAVSDLLRIIGRVRPEVIVTFGPEGLMRGHPDHRATHRLVRFAWPAARAQEPALRKLYYVTATRSTARALGLPRPPRVTTHVFVRDFQQRKRAAFGCYASQAHARARVDRFIATQQDWEVFSLAEGRPGPTDPAGLEPGLFG